MFQMTVTKCEECPFVHHDQFNKFSGGTFVQYYELSCKEQHYKTVQPKTIDEDCPYNESADTESESKSC